MQGELRDTWDRMSCRVTSMMVTPDSKRLIVAGMHDLPPPPNPRRTTSDAPSGEDTGEDAGGATIPVRRLVDGLVVGMFETRLLIYDLATKQLETWVH